MEEPIRQVRLQVCLFLVGRPIKCRVRLAVGHEMREPPRSVQLVHLVQFLQHLRVLQPHLDGYVHRVGSPPTPVPIPKRCVPSSRSYIAFSVDISWIRDAECISSRGISASGSMKIPASRS